MKKSYIGLAFIILIFGIWVVKEINARYYSKSDLYEIGSAPSFELTNQDDKKISDKDYLGKVHVIEFFFSTCPTICPKMNQNMLKIQDEFLNEKDFGIVSITINPDYDTPEVLKEHAHVLGVKHPNWNFLTGDKAYIFDLANKGFNMYAGENKKAMGGFEHSGMFALVDKEGNIRCRTDQYGNPILYYDGIDQTGVENIIEDIKKLLQE
ncbi:SCO family protein [Flavobacterium haoranii]|uniref:Protein SCO1/2 n=1 Tax=Flavobacterium haoranii TaxID=683124 RepID=A0A1M6FUE1_9FLAO|nr:SCO family protein [Flavobacterium haoranii]SHJ01270.1 protein SCO1/2 [Flavobacterium haoranii]